MKDKQKLEALIHLLKLLNLGEHPTLRETGIPEATILELKNEKLIRLGDTGESNGPEDLDRYVVVEVTTLALSWLLQQEEKAKQAALHPSLFSRISSAVGKKLWDLIWDAVKVAVGIAVGWYLHRCFGVK